MTLTPTNLLEGVARAIAVANGQSPDEIVARPPRAMLGWQAYLDDAQAIFSHIEEKGLVLVEGWRPIESAWRLGEQRVIVTDGNSVWGAGWWHAGEQAWLDCGGITPTLYMLLPDPPAALTQESER